MKREEDGKMWEEVSRDSRKSQRRSRRDERRERAAQRNRNKEFAGVTYFFVILFIAVMAYLVYYTAVQSKITVNSPYNKRQEAFADRIVRGDIVDRNGNVMATTKRDENGNETRVYPYGNVFSHVVGYYDPKLGSTGLEAAENFDLLTSNAFFAERLKNEFKGEKNIGDTVVTTLDAGLQEAADKAMGGNKGAVIVMEASTGKVLVMLSKPAVQQGDKGCLRSRLHLQDCYGAGLHETECELFRFHLRLHREGDRGQAHASLLWGKGTRRGES